MLIILGGLPGVGKSTIGKGLAKKIQAVYLRIDSIEQAIKDAAKFSPNKKVEIFAEGYIVGCAVAKDNLEIGFTVITDSVNPVEASRSGYRKMAEEACKPYFEVEIICSNNVEHKKRVENRDASIPGLKLPTWQDILDREYEDWKTKNMTIDTAIYSEAEAIDMIISELNKKT